QLIAEADLKGTTDKALQFLLNSPLKSKFGKAVSTIKAAGESHLRFTLKVPLSNADDTQVVGNISFIDSALYEASATEMGVTKINGLLQFSNTGVTAKGITAQFLNNTIVLNVKPTKKDTAISVTGKVDMADINTIWPNKVPEFISGKTDYTVNVTVVEESYGEFYVDAGLSSDLEGLQIALPAPIKKDKTSKKPFTASFKHIDDSLAYVIKYGEQFNAIVMNNTDLWRGELRFGSGEAKLPKLGVRVRGQLNELVLDDWLALVDKQQTGEESALAKSLDDVSIEISALKGFEQLFEHVNLSAERDAQGWRAKIHSDQAKGSIYIPNDFENNAILKIKLDEARLLTSKTEAKKAEGSQLAKTKKSTLWPSMDISIKSLFLDGFALGKLDIQASQHARAWRVDSASLQSDIFTATTNVPNISQKSEWKQTETGDISTLQLQAKSNNISQLLANFDYQEVIEAEEATFTISLSWADNPLALFSHPLQGRLTVDVGEGALIEVEPGAAGRIFGLLSVAAIPQRLSLDFSDLFGEGFSFDSIKGTFDLANGLATTNDFELKGAPATVEMRGPIDLANKRYNQKVTIRPNVSSALPLAGAVAAGPVGLAAGAAILLFDKVAGTIFDTEIVNIISYSYNLTGPWDEPEMTVARPKTP
ncbi:MAG: DUF3971 domain-containing protein, partial [Proteobacteria bacterium]|nr:DUF3971 domain-containing protein [Pseudomonadota bacterium]